jgi:hypothetical protein
MTLTITAEQMFRNAYENRYTWDENFGGYEADVTMKTDDATHTGKVLINSDLTFDVQGVEDEEAARAIKSQLWEMTIHRVNHSFAKSHGENTFSFGETDENGAIEILVGGAGQGNSYKIKDNCVCFVNRKIGNKIVNINTFQFQQTDKGYLAEGYDSIYIDPETGKPLTGKTLFADKFEPVGDYYVLTSRTITSSKDDRTETTEFVFSNFKP